MQASKKDQAIVVCRADKQADEMSCAFVSPIVAKAEP
jgi:hypothetical protein